MARIHMREIVDSINRLRSGESERAIREDLGYCRVTVDEPLSSARGRQRFF